MSLGTAVRASLTRHLLAWTLGALVLVWVTFVVVGYRTGLLEADELTDGDLASVASLLLASRSDGQFADKGNPAELAGPSDLKRHDYQQSLSVVVWDGQGRLVTRTGEAPTPAFSAEEGFRTIELGDPPTSWRTFSRWDGSARQRRIMVLLSLRERDDLAEDIAGQIAEPGLWLLPVIALVLGLAIRRGLRPLYALASDVHALDIHRPEPLAHDYPQQEFRAMVGSINTLAGRYQSALERERELANELAHELRTPLASLALQARAVRESPSGPERERALMQMERDTLRAGHVLSDLLLLARASRTELAEAAQIFDLADLAREVVADFAQMAYETRHELAVAGSDSLPMSGHRVLMGLALRNLVENALHHTPAGSAVEVQWDASARWLQVCDAAPEAGVSGKAHPDAAPLSVGSAGALGLGLGHRVVGKIAAIHGGSFESVAPPPPGFANCYRINLPPWDDQA